MTVNKINHESSIPEFVSHASETINNPFISPNDIHDTLIPVRPPNVFQPIKPKDLPQNPSADDYIKYGNELKVYEERLAKANSFKTSFNEKKKKAIELAIDQMMPEFDTPMRSLDQDSQYEVANTAMILCYEFGEEDEHDLFVTVINQISSLLIKVKNNNE